ncbi:Phosphatidylinositol 3,4,5-trisphosphate 3-phosphatase and dual-specificity protein phosphatase PTEN [Sphaceloma murrayae]|uniref:phosphatidylinositol-3,4,5-trisphosphate 3-phosphatase n=1 Tax=Sphaceloma murrayae TaxID=2082308 RepID=A0A2K1R158_9PEZI|nr:Phosphatidylinositol 3,4,5-trisphosphate 3-phosphatase and dual-specificity protein phosphatase PTEN [Sphaceloma murrayae]
MASLLRQIVSGPRARHPEAGLDLCYVTDNIIATSGPTGTYPQLAYRTPLKQLVKFLDEKHGDNWAIWEFRAEGTGYPDSEVYNRIYHYPWPDHHPPPFALIPLIMGSMRNWLKGNDRPATTEPELSLPSSAPLGPPSPIMDQTDLDAREKSEELVQKLKAVRLSQTGEPDSSPSLAPPDPSLNAETFVSAPHSPSNIPDHLGLPIDTAASSPSVSGTSTPNSTRRKKEVRWRESTLLPPKELRATSPSSPEMDRKEAKRKEEKRKADRKREEKEGAQQGKSRNPLSRKTKGGDVDGKMIRSTKAADGTEEKETKTETDKEKDAGLTTRPGEASSEKGERVVVVHCKAGKGRSGTVSCSYLISQEGWSLADALGRFTERRMRPGFGAGVSIPSQLRWVSYVDRWTRGGKRYVERAVEIVEVHVWGLRDRVKVSIEGFADEGRRIEVVHSFDKAERETVREEKKGQGVLASVGEVVGQEREKRRRGKTNGAGADKSALGNGEAVEKALEELEPRRARTTYEDLQEEEGGGDVVLRPKERVVTKTGDVNIDFERRNKGVTGLTMITSVAHVWFNAFFEGDGPERDGTPLTSGVFEMEWDKMDGIKGSSRKGTRAFDRLAVAWKLVEDGPARQGTIIKMPEEGEGIKDHPPADWRGGEDKDATRDLGEEADSLSSGVASRESSIQPDRKDGHDTHNGK